MEKSEMDATTEADQIAATGVTGLDEVLRGGLPMHHMYFIQGDPGAGKTTLSFQFLLEGVRRGEKTMYVTLSASTRDLQRVARSHGWTLDGIDIHEQFHLADASDTTIFRPAEIELAKTVTAILEAIDARQPDRVVIDSLAEIRLLSESALRYRRQLLVLKEFFRERRITALVLDDLTISRESEIQGLAEGVVRLCATAPMYGNTRRRLEVVKMRGVDFRGGFHDFTIVRGGMTVFPRLAAVEYETSRQSGLIRSGLAEMDNLVGGGLERGTTTMIMGPAGVGKSSLSLQFAISAAAAGERVTFFIFEEHRSVFLKRAASLGFDLPKLMEDGRLTVHQIDPAEMSTGEFAYAIRTSIEKDSSSMIIIDSLNGYFNAMPEEHFLTLHLHELLSYLADAGVTSILIVSQHGALGQVSSPVDVSYLADAVILLRYYETSGAFRRAISMLKKRTSEHEQSVRDYELTSSGVRIGNILEGFRGILSGMQSTDSPTPALSHSEESPARGDESSDRSAGSDRNREAGEGNR